MKKIKHLLIGILIGVIISTSVAALGTDLISKAYFNSDLKLAINGNPIDGIRIVTVEVEGEKYGRNYYSIADLIKAFNVHGGISAKVDFDSGTQTTVIEVEHVSNTKVEEMGDNMRENLKEHILSVIESAKELEPKTPDGLPVEIWKGKQYIGYLQIRLKANETGFTFLKNSDNGKWQLIKMDTSFKNRKFWETLESDEIIIDDVPTTYLSGYGKSGVELDYYINNIMPIIKQGGE